MISIADHLVEIGNSTVVRLWCLNQARASWEVGALDKENRAVAAVFPVEDPSELPGTEIVGRKRQ